MNYVIKSLALLFVLALVSCEEEQLLESPTVQSAPIEFRTYDNSWLKNFQTHLLHQYNGEVSEASYSLEEVIYGVELLMNFKSGQKTLGLSEVYNTRTISLNGDAADIDLFDKVNKAVQEDLISINGDESKDFFFVELSTISAGSKVKLSIKTHAKDNGTCGIQHYIGGGGGDDNCDEEPFEATEAYYGGWYGFEYDDDFTPELMCPEECGTVPACSNTSNFAMEQLENHLQGAICDPVCPSPLIWDGTYSDIRECSIMIEWEDDFFRDSCLPQETSDDFINAEDGRCYCFDATELNCLYGLFCEAMKNKTFPFGDDACWPALSSEHVIMDVDFGVDYLSSNNNHTALTVTSWYGVPNCVMGIIGPTHEHALVMPLPAIN